MLGIALKEKNETKDKNESGVDDEEN